MERMSPAVVSSALLLLACQQAPDVHRAGGQTAVVTTLGAELSIDDAIASTTGLHASEPAIAFDGTNYLVVWSDARDNRQPDIWAARVAPTGAVLDATSFPIAIGAGAQLRPAVTFDGAQFIVVWEDFQSELGTEANLAAAIVSPSGSVTALPAVASSAASETHAALDSNGAGALATWVSSGQIMGAHFTAGGFGAPFAITAGTSAKSDPALDAAPGGRYLLVYTEASPTTADDTRGQLLDSSGTSIGPAFVISGGAVATRNPSVSFDGTNFQVVFSSYYTGVDIYGTRVTPAGQVLDTHVEGTEIIGGRLIYDGVNYQETPSIACHTSGCLVSWQDKRNLATTGYDIYGQRVATDMTTVGSDFPISTAALSQLQVSTIAASGEYFVIWRDARAGGNAALKIGGTRVSSTGQVASPTGELLNRGFNSQHGVALGKVGSTIVLGWNDARSLWGDDLELVRVTPSGTFLDSSPRTLSDGLHAQVETAVVGVGAQFLFAWSDNRSGRGTDIFVARADSATGNVTDTAGIAIGTSPGEDTRPQLASNGTTALVVWSNTTGSEKTVHGAIVDGTGTASSPFVIADAAGEQGGPAVTYSAATGEYVVVWQDSRAGDYDIYATRVSPTGVVLDPGGIVVSSATGRQILPKIVGTGADLFIAYQDDRNGNWDIYGTRARLGGGLAVLDVAGIALTSNASHQAGPALATVGSSHFLVAWSDERAFATNDIDVFGQVVSTSGAVLGSNFAIAETSAREVAPSMIEAGSQRIAIGYHRHRSELHATRVVLRFLEIDPSCEGGDQGCTPGYWRNHADRWSGAAPSDGYDATFGITSALGGTYRLADAIKANGGGERALARHAVAALLNAYGGVPNSDGSVVQFPYTPLQVIGLVQDAYAAGTAAAINAAKNQLADANELGCPLSGTRAVKVE
jgi:hypothetical protein